MKYRIHLECKKSPICNYFMVTDSECFSYYFWWCCHGCQVCTVEGASHAGKPTWRAGSFFLSWKVPEFDRPTILVGLISQERKITDFRVLGLGLPLFPPFPLGMWHSLEKRQPQLGCVPHTSQSSRPPHAGRFSGGPSCVSWGHREPSSLLWSLCVGSTDVMTLRERWIYSRMKVATVDASIGWKRTSPHSGVTSPLSLPLRVHTMASAPPAPRPAVAVGLVLAEGTESTLPELSSVLLCFHFLSGARPSPTGAPACWSGWGMQRELSCPGQGCAHGPVPSEPPAADRCLSEPSWGCRNGPAKS